MDDVLLEKKINIMLGMQSDINSRVDKDWLDRNREWYRALWIECGELMDHYGQWKWWKHTTTDLPQVVLEIVDIWHFGLSIELCRRESIDVLSADIAKRWKQTPSKVSFLEEVERVASYALKDKGFAIGSIRNLLEDCCVDFDILYRTYVAKNVLNIFRQDHGYKDGTYIKIWDGKEDNEVLAVVLEDADSDAFDFKACLYNKLEKIYPGKRS
jgi:dimeric dUTPase (all-alpha-NTP-PPase superfamily)